MTLEKMTGMAEQLDSPLRDQIALPFCFKGKRMVQLQEEGRKNV